MRPTTALTATAALLAPLVLLAPTEAAHPSAERPAAQHVSLRADPVASTAATPAGPTAAPVQPLAARRMIIGHRGAAGYRPEHTLASYELAARMGADYVEPDLVPTKDGVLVARHENDITATTDVADHPELAGRRTTKTIDGVVLTGWFVEDLTLAEIKTLRAKERLPQIREENTLYDGLYQIPTFDEVLALRARLSDELGRQIGVYPETKHPTYFDSIGLSPEEPMLASLAAAGLDDADDPVFIQSFEPSNLRELHAEGVKVPLVQLLSATGAPADAVAAGSPITYADAVTPRGLAFIATYAAGIGPDKNQVIPRNADDTLGTPTSLVADAHAAGLQVHPYTFRNENQFLPADLRTGDGQTEDDDDYGRVLEEEARFWATGIDAMFTDQTDTAVVSRAVAEGTNLG